MVVFLGHSIFQLEILISSVMQLGSFVFGQYHLSQIHTELGKIQDTLTSQFEAEDKSEWHVLLHRFKLLRIQNLQIQKKSKLREKAFQLYCDVLSPSSVFL